MDSVAAERADAERVLEKEVHEGEVLKRKTQELEREVEALRESLVKAKSGGNQRFNIDDF